MTSFLFRSLVRTVQTLPVANLIFPPFSTNRRRPAYDTSNDGMFPVPLMRHLCNFPGEFNADFASLCAQPSQKTFRTKRILAKASRQNR